MGGCPEAASLDLEGRELGSTLTGGSALSSRKELTAEARELKGELYCLPCHDKMGVPICGACRRPIEGRVVNALGKQWHVEVSKAGVDSRWGPGSCSHSLPAPGCAASSRNRPSSWVLPFLAPGWGQVSPQGPEA